MNEKARARYEARAKIIKALAHPTRLYIVDKLAEQEHCVCELTEMVGADTSTVSKHLSVLKNAGIITDRKHGTQVYYSLKVPCALDILTCTDLVLQAVLEEQLALIR